MNNVFNYINNAYIYNLFEKIDENIEINYINESLKSSILQELVKQITKTNNERKDKGYYYNNNTFKNLFGREYVLWDKVTDSDFEIVNYVPDDSTDKNAIKERKKMEQEVRKVIKNETNSLVLLRRHSDGEFMYYYTPWGSLLSIKDGSKIMYGYGRNAKDLNQRDKMSYLKEMDIYYLTITDELGKSKIQNDRRRSREGMYDPRSEWDMVRYAENNVKRYKEIIAKNKAQKELENDTLVDDVNELLQEVMSIANEYNKNIVKYADLTSDLQTLLSLVYDKRVYTGNTSKGQSQYRGSNGLLYYLSSYLSNKTSAIKDKGYTAMYQEYTENAKKGLEKQLEIIYNKLEEIKDKMK